MTDDLMPMRSPQMRTMDAAERKAFGESVLALLAERAGRYTMGDSGSVRVETAKRLLNGILYCVDLHLRAHSDADASASSVRRLYEAGVRDVERLVRRGRLLLKQAETARPPVENIAFRDTLAALPAFFCRYDAAFFAHEIPCDIDYPLCRPAAETLRGVEYVNDYLRRLLTESAFLRRFDGDMLRLLYERYYGDFDGLPVNLYTPAADAAVGRALADRSVQRLFLDAADAAAVRRRFAGRTDEDGRRMLADAAAAVCRELSIESASARAYLSGTALDLLPRIRAAGGAPDTGGVFVSQNDGTPTAGTDDVFTDGPMMDDESLRRLIGRLQDCRSVSGRLAMVRRGVRSLRDLVEILDAVPDDALHAALIGSLDRRERRVLARLAAERADGGETENGWDRLILHMENGDR